MSTVRRLYDRVDAWLRDRSRGAYAVFLGVSCGIGVLIAGLLVSGDLLVVQAATMALVMFGLEWVFGLHQPSDE